MESEPSREGNSKRGSACEKVRCARHLRDQLQRAALSIVLNTAEGAAKPTIKDRRRFYAIAYGSAREVQALLGILGEPELLKQSDVVGGCLYRLMTPK